MASRKSSGKTSAVTLATQPHGGALQVGNPGNVGGTGRPPSILRDRLRGSFEARVTILEQIADGRPIQQMKIGDVVTKTEISADLSDRIKAIDMLAKYGLGTMKEVSVENVRDRVQATIDVIRKYVPVEQASAILAELRPIWA